MIRNIVVCFLMIFAAGSQDAEGSIVFDFDLTDFSHTDVVSDIRIMDFVIDLDATLAPGVFVDTAVNQIDYRIFGVLVPGTPSGFPAFDLNRTIVGNDFYTQGGSMRFAIAAGADLTDGLQVSDLVDNGVDPVFELNAREVLTGRFHPAHLRLFGDGTGILQNSNNVPNGMIGEIAAGAEYVTNLNFAPATFTLVAAVPEPSSAIVFLVAGTVLFGRRRFRRPGQQ